MCIEKDRTAVRQVSPAKNTIEIDNKTVIEKLNVKSVNIEVIHVLPSLGYTPSLAIKGGQVTDPKFSTSGRPALR